MKNKKAVGLTTLLLSTLVLGSFAILGTLPVSYLSSTANPSEYAIIFDGKTNKITENDNWQVDITNNNIDLLSKSRKVNFGASYIKNAPNGWQILKKEGGYIQNIDHIIGMDSIELKFTTSSLGGEFDLYYSPSMITAENKSDAYFYKINGEPNKTNHIIFNFENKKPNYFRLEALIDDITIDYCKIVINKECRDFYFDASISSQDINKGTVNKIKSRYLPDEEITISASAKEGYYFKGWFDEDNKLISTDNPYSFRMPNKNINYRAEFYNYLNFGSYPQSKVTDNQLIIDLNNLAGPVPTNLAANQWTSYKFYYGVNDATLGKDVATNVDNYMWYQDITLNSNKYRGVYFDKYRGNFTTSTQDAASSLQDNYGYTVNTIYWFKYEPIKWKTLDSSSMIISDLILDAREFYHLNGPRDVNGEFLQANNYSVSNIRTWLNNDFYTLAFNDAEKEKITTSLIKNDLSSTLDSNNKYVCQDTNDKVFLMSKQEANEEYLGFFNDSSRQVKSTQYAECLGCYHNLDSLTSRWWTRTPSKNKSYGVVTISQTGAFGDWNCYGTAHGGVRPAINISLI